MMKPIYFIVTFWGRQYADYFRESTLATLGPQLRPCDKWLIVCPCADRPDYLDPNKFIWIELPPIGDNPVYKQQNEGQKLAYQWCFEHKVWASMASPDYIVSDNYVQTLIRLQSEGYDLVQHTALRQNETTFRAEAGDRKTFSPRELAGLNIRHLHREQTPFFQGSRMMPWLPPMRLWKCEDQLILHCYIANPILMNFGSIEKLNLRCVRYLAVENVFLDYNFTDVKRYLITDSDELCTASLSPDYPPAWKERGSRPRWWLDLGLRMSRYLWPRSGGYVFARAAYWHCGELKHVTSTEEFCAGAFRFGPLSFTLGYLARFYLLHFLPFLRRKKRIRNAVRWLRNPDLVGCK